MKKLSKRENQIMIALWNSSVPLSASALKKNLDEDVSIYTIQQVLQKLLKKDYIKVDRIVQHEKALMREYVPVISQVEYITSFVNQKTSFELTSKFIKETDNLDAIIELEKLINIKLKEKGIK
jgi:BlaI family penicillinase repressor